MLSNYLNSLFACQATLYNHIEDDQTEYGERQCPIWLINLLSMRSRNSSWSSKILEMMASNNLHWPIYFAQRERQNCKVRKVLQKKWPLHRRELIFWYCRSTESHPNSITVKWKFGNPQFPNCCGRKMYPVLFKFKEFSRSYFNEKV